MEEAGDLARLKQKIAVYQPSEATCDLVRATPKLFLVGISGAGKDTIMRELMQTGQYYAIVSHTTRAPRENNGMLERDGVEYHFITLAQAERMLDTGEYIEAKLYGTNIYGTSVSEMQRANELHKIAVTDIEIQGVAEYMKLDPTTKAVFVLPPSYDIWQERLVRRYGQTLDHAILDTRVRTALLELDHVLATPYFQFVVNDNLSDAVAEIHAIAVGGERHAEASHARAIAQAIRDQLAHAYA